MPDLGDGPLKSASRETHSERFVPKLFGLRKSSFARGKIGNRGFRGLHRRVIARVCIVVSPSCEYPSQTKSWKAEQKRMCVFSIDFSNRSWPNWSTHALEKCFENPHFLFCSAFQHPLQRYKRIHPEDKATHRRVIACVCILFPHLANILQKYKRTRWQTMRCFVFRMDALVSL